MLAETEVSVFIRSYVVGQEVCQEHPTSFCGIKYLFLPKDSGAMYLKIWLNF